MSLAHFYIHHGGEKGVGGTLMGSGRQGFTGAFLLLFLMQLGLPPGLETPGWSCLSLPLTQQPGPLPWFWGVCGSRELAGVGTSHPNAGLPLPHRPETRPQLPHPADLFSVAISLSRKKETLSNTWGRRSLMGCECWRTVAASRLGFESSWGSRRAAATPDTLLPLGRGLGCPPLLGELPALGFSGGRLVAHHHAPRPSQPQ